MDSAKTGEESMKVGGELCVSFSEQLQHCQSKCPYCTLSPYLKYLFDTENWIKEGNFFLRRGGEPPQWERPLQWLIAVICKK